MPDREYGDVHITRQSPLVERADPVALCALSSVQDSFPWFLAGPDILHIGHDPNGEPVYYRVTGWDSERRALIVQRCDPQGELLSVPAPAGQEDPASLNVAQRVAGREPVPQSAT